MSAIKTAEIMAKFFGTFDVVAPGPMLIDSLELRAVCEAVIDAKEKFNHLLEAGADRFTTAESWLSEHAGEK